MFKNYKLDDYNRKKEFELDAEGVKSVYDLKPKTQKNYEFALAKSDGSYSYLASFDSIEEGEKLYKNLVKNKGINEMVVVINNKGKIIYAEQAIGRVIKHINGAIDQTVNNITKIYMDRDLKNDFTYINHGYIDDVPIIESNEHLVKVQVAGYTGWIQNDINSGNYDIVIVPLNQVKNPSYYIVKNGELKHFISSDILSDSKDGYEISIGKAPKYLNENQKYYSYDGSYFYNSLNDLLTDKKDDSINRAVNTKKKL